MKNGQACSRTDLPVRRGPVGAGAAEPRSGASGYALANGRPSGRAPRAIRDPAGSCLHQQPFRRRAHRAVMPREQSGPNQQWPLARTARDWLVSSSPASSRVAHALLVSVGRLPVAAIYHARRSVSRDVRAGQPGRRRRATVRRQSAADQWLRCGAASVDAGGSRPRSISARSVMRWPSPRAGGRRCSILPAVDRRRTWSAPPMTAGRTGTGDLPLPGAGADPAGGTGWRWPATICDAGSYGALAVRLAKRSAVCRWVACAGGRSGHVGCTTLTDRSTLIGRTLRRQKAL